MTRSDHGRYAEFAVEDDPSLPERFQNYVIDKNKLGEGPISFCYRAKRLDNESPVRLKVLRKRLSNDRDIFDLFHKHARTLAEFRGDLIQPFNKAASHDNILIYEYEWIQGASLRSLIDDHAPLHPDLVSLIAQAILQALTQVHGVRPSPGMGNLIPLHKNLRPENVIVSEQGKVQVTDVDMLPFCHVCDRKRLALPYSLSVFESPEQLLKSGYADRRSDIYALGMVMLEMASGKLPYFGNNVFEVRQNIREDLRDDVASLFPSYGDSATRALMKSLAKIIGQMIEANPERRPQQLIDVESKLIDYFAGSAYDEPNRIIADFVRKQSFQPERARKRGFIDRLFGG